MLIPQEKALKNTNSFISSLFAIKCKINGPTAANMMA